MPGKIGDIVSLFAGKVAIVTGGASGLGQALCSALAEAGAKVIVADIDVSRAGQVERDLWARGHEAYAVYLDVADADSVKRVVSDTVAHFGCLDLMFNNAAAPWSRSELRDQPWDEWHQAINVNLLGVLNGTIAAYETMARQGFGHIVNTASIAGLVGYPTSIHYSATKAAVVNLSYSMRMEAKGSGVNVSVVCPGPIHGKSRYWFKLIGTEVAAQRILNGVARNQTFIVFPWVARVLWLAYRLSPALLFPVGSKLVRKFRDNGGVRRAIPADALTEQ